MRTVLAIAYLTLCGYLSEYHLEDTHCNEWIGFITAPFTVCLNALR